MRTLCSALLLLSLASSALAETADPIKAKFYDMGEQVIDGEIKRPQAVWIEARRAVRFDPLLKLKKSFLPAIQATASDRVFK